MKKKLFLFAFCAVFSIVHCFAQDAISIQIGKKTLKEGKNLVKSTPTLKVYAEVQDKKVVRVYVVDNTSKNEIEVEDLQVVAAPVGPGDGTGTPTFCLECTCTGVDKKGKCILGKCKQITCPITTAH